MPLDRREEALEGAGRESSRLLAGLGRVRWAAAVRQPVGGVGATGSQCGGPAQRLPLDNYAYCYSLSLDLALRDFEAELEYCTQGYAKAVQKQTVNCGWLNPLEYSFMGKGTMTWKDKQSDYSKGKRAGSSGGQEYDHGISSGGLPGARARPEPTAAADGGPAGTPVELGLGLGGHWSIAITLASQLPSNPGSKA